MSREGAGGTIPRHRLGAWLVTGPVGRLVGFGLDFAAELGRSLGRKAAGRKSRRPLGR